MNIDVIKPAAGLPVSEDLVVVEQVDERVEDTSDIHQTDLR